MLRMLFLIKNPKTFGNLPLVLVYGVEGYGLGPTYKRKFWVNTRVTQNLAEI